MSFHQIQQDGKTKMSWDIYRKCACGSPIMRKDKKVKLCLGCIRENRLRGISGRKMPTFGGHPVAFEQGWK